MAESLSIRVRFFKDLPLYVEKPVQMDSCIVPEHLWMRWINNQSTEVLLLKVQVNETKHIFTVDSSHNLPRNVIYIADHYATEFDRETIYQAELLEEMPPIATQITLQLLESDFGDIDIASAASEYLSKCNVLKNHSILQIPFPDLGDLVLDVFVADTKPEDFVLLRGEVPLEIASGHHHEELVPQLQRPLTPVPITDFSQIIGDEMFPGMSGGSSSSFTPFCGKGNRLGS
jgi:hypothetical protein